MAKPVRARHRRWDGGADPCARPDGKGWNLYVEFYPHKYGLYAAPQIEGPWRRMEMKSPDARHGSVVEIDAKTMRALREAYPDGGTPD